MKHIFSFIIFMSLLLTACTSAAPAIIPSAERPCKSTVNWQGLIPGQSTTKDVIRILGNPSEKGKVKFENKRISYYAYDVDGGVIADYAKHRIFFTKNGVIDWMEIIEADHTDTAETAFDIVSLLGNELDVVYSNNNFRPGETFYDVIGGPTSIYVWSECGAAIEALPSSEASYFGTIETGCEKGHSSPQTCILSFRHRYPPLHPYPHYDVNSIVLMKFYFRPTSYQGFADYYMYKIPFRTWGEYLRALGE
jgi:hypothetical protein